MIRLIVPEDKPAEKVDAWKPTIAFLERVAEAEKIRVEAVILHSHPEGSLGCFDGEADFDEYTVTLCSGQDKETILHELAHLSVNDYHSRKWAIETMRLHSKYLSPKKALHADRVLAIEYRSARPLFAAKYGFNSPKERRGDACGRR
jgi:hypothetical protein